MVMSARLVLFIAILRLLSPRRLFDKLQEELCFLKKGIPFVQNGYPVQLLSKLFSEPDVQATVPEFGPDPCLVFLSLLWDDQISLDAAHREDCGQTNLVCYSIDNSLC